VARQDKRPAVPVDEPAAATSTPPTPGAGELPKTTAPKVPPSPATAAEPAAPGHPQAIQTTPTPGQAVGGVFAEAALMARLHELAETNPPLSLQLAREGNARFPDSPDAPERAWIVVKSLADLARFKEAQAEARIMLAKYPDDPRALDVQRHLLTNPLR